MRQQFDVTHRYTDLQETKEIWQILNRPTLKQVWFSRKYKEKTFCYGYNSTLKEGALVTCCGYNNILKEGALVTCCGYNSTLTEGALVTQVFSNAGISVWRIVWVTTGCWVMSDLILKKTAPPPFETSAALYQTTRFNIPEVYNH